MEKNTELDSFTWLEDVDSLESKKWITEQEKKLNDYLENSPSYKNIFKDFNKSCSSELSSVPQSLTNFHYYTKARAKDGEIALFRNSSIGSGLGDEEEICSSSDFIKKKSRILSFYVSPDESRVALKIDEEGSDWNRIAIFCIEDNSFNILESSNIRISHIDWSMDSKEVLYTESNMAEKNIYNIIGYNVITGHKECLYTVESPTPMANVSYYGVDDEIVIIQTNSTRNNSVISVKRKSEKVSALNSEYKWKYDFVGAHNNEYFFISNEDENFKYLIKFHQETGEWTKVFTSEKGQLSSAYLYAGKVVLNYFEDCKSKLYVINGSGELLKEIVPEIPSTIVLGQARSVGTIFVGITNYNTRLSIRKLRLDDYELKGLNEKSVEIVTEQVFVSTDDDEKIPMFISYNKSFKKDGSRPLVIRSYGGFSYINSPRYFHEMRKWMELGGVLAVANVRGGGEYGERWHKGGIREKKQNSINDLISCTEYLIEKKYSSVGKIGLYGNSNGGFLISAACSQRPDLFTSIVIDRGLLDLEKFNKYPAGWAWVNEYGDPKKSIDLQRIKNLSPYVNISEKNSVATLVVTSDTDNRVSPIHSYKYLAKLESVSKEKSLLHISYKTGHGLGRKRDDFILEKSIQLAFLIDTLGLK